MPPRGRKPAATSTRPNQSTLAFNSKSARVSKPSATEAAKSNKKSAKQIEPTAAVVEEIAKAEVAPPEEEEEQHPTYSEAAIQEQAQTEVEKPKDDFDIKAAVISDKALRTYWRKEEESRIAPRVHQKDLPVNERILRHFDISSQYGPCIGIPRMKRWKRANGLGLNPPIEVLAVLLKEESKNNARMERAYVDELMNGKGIVE
ncbi:MAG: hypothetical protein Q9227_006116 [Pyrenula ochraceoflavens]